jgi:hypothetical protein
MEKRSGNRVIAFVLRIISVPGIVTRLAEARAARGLAI